MTSPLIVLSVEVAEAADEERDASEQEEPREERLDRRLRRYKGYKMIGLYGQGQGQSKGSKYGVRVRAKCLLIVACESFMRSKSFWPS